MNGINDLTAAVRGDIAQYDGTDWVKKITLTEASLSEDQLKAIVRDLVSNWARIDSVDNLKKDNTRFVPEDKINLIGKKISEFNELTSATSVQREKLYLLLRDENESVETRRAKKSKISTISIDENKVVDLHTSFTEPWARKVLQNNIFVDSGISIPLEKLANVIKEFELGTRLVAREFNLQSNNLRGSGIWSDGFYIYVSDNNANRIFVYRLDNGDSQESLSFDLDSLNDTCNDIWGNDSILWVGQVQDLTLFAYNIKIGDDNYGQRDASKDITLDATNNNPTGFWSDNKALYVVDSIQLKVFIYSIQESDFNTRLTNLEFNLHSDNLSPRGLWSDNYTLYVINGSTFSGVSRRVFAYKLNIGIRDITKEFNLNLSNSDPNDMWSNGNIIYVSDQIAGKIFSYSLGIHEPAFWSRVNDRRFIPDDKIKQRVIIPNEQGQLRLPTEADVGLLAIDHSNIRIGKKITTAVAHDLQVTYRNFVTSDLPSSGRYIGVFNRLSDIALPQGGDVAFISSSRTWRQYSSQGLFSSWVTYNSPSNWRGTHADENEANRAVNAVGDVTWWSSASNVKVVDSYTPAEPDHFGYIWTLPSEITELFNRKTTFGTSFPTTYLF